MTSVLVCSRSGRSSRFDLLRFIDTSTTLTPRSARQASRSSCGFCESGHGQPPGVRYDASGRCKGHLLRCRPAFNLGRGSGHAVPGEGLFDPGEAVGLPPAAGAQAVPERYAYRLGYLSPHPASGDICVGIPPGSGGFMKSPSGVSGRCCPARRAGLRRAREAPPFATARGGHRSRSGTSTASTANAVPMRQDGATRWSGPGRWWLRVFSAERSSGSVPWRCIGYVDSIPRAR